jgi:hypothetical protein
VMLSKIGSTDADTRTAPIKHTVFIGSSTERIGLTIKKEYITGERANLDVF